MAKILFRMTVNCTTRILKEASRLLTQLWFNVIIIWEHHAKKGSHRQNYILLYRVDDITFNYRI